MPSRRLLYDWLPCNHIRFLLFFSPLHHSFNFSSIVSALYTLLHVIFPLLQSLAHCTLLHLPVALQNVDVIPLPGLIIECTTLYMHFHAVRWVKLLLSEFLECKFPIILNYGSQFYGTMKVLKSRT